MVWHRYILFPDENQCETLGTGIITQLDRQPILLLRSGVLAGRVGGLCLVCGDNAFQRVHLRFGQTLGPRLFHELMHLLLTSAPAWR
jgi:hypothetical protein